MFDPANVKRTEILYRAMKKFTDARAAARDAYLKTAKKYESDKGSTYYRDKMNQAMNDRRGAVDVARAEAARTIDDMIKGMYLHASKHKMQAPTDEQLRILTALKLRDRLTLNELEQAANAMDGNGAGLAIIEEIAQKHSIPHPNYNALARDGLSSDAARKAIDSLGESCKRILNGTGATRAAEANIARQNMLGYNIDPDTQLQEPPYESEADFYGRNINMPYEVFADAVNGAD